MELFETFLALKACFAPSGQETALAHVIERLAAPYADEVYRDALGNLVVHRKGSGPRLMISAHMDSVGLVVTHIEAGGQLRVGRLGGFVPYRTLYTPVCFANGTRGVVACDAKADPQKLEMDDLFIDIGVFTREEAEAKVSLGDMAVYDAPAFRAEGMVVSPHLDNRLMCAALLTALSADPARGSDLYCVFTTQEELGMRGAKTAAWAIDPHYAVSLDLTVASDAMGNGSKGSAVCGGGAAVKIMDRSLVCHPQIVELLLSLARAKGIKAQRDVTAVGVIEAGPIQRGRGGVKAGALSVPCRYVHTPVETAALGDAQACADLLTTLMAEPLLTEMM